ncbi:hypothetical protein Noda2021_02460 [Candidatus Dependentiae bacterium Noda2021]|nr:hypothetical protein Noda2021_02460 [Candidatus Dependentiae bacterium Noda2021]
MLILYRLQDAFEILIFSFIIYKLSLFITSNNKQAVNMYWIYATSLLVTYLVSLNNTLLFLLLVSPIIITLFIVLHQEKIQKNFLAHKTKFSENPADDTWSKILIRECMLRLHNNQSTQCIIQTAYDISSLVDNPYPVNVKIIPGLITLIGTSTQVDSEKFLLFNSTGYLQGINVTITSSQATSVNWIDNAHVLTSQLNILVFKTSTQTQTFDIVIAGELIFKKTASQTQEIIDSFLHKSLKAAKGSQQYDHKTKNTSKSAHT